MTLSFISALFFLIWFIGSVAFSGIVGFLVWAFTRKDMLTADKYAVRAFWLTLLLLWGKGICELAGILWT
jgi:hypothetical protein